MMTKWMRTTVIFAIFLSASACGKSKQNSAASANRPLPQATDKDSVPAPGGNPTDEKDKGVEGPETSEVDLKGQERHRGHRGPPKKAQEKAPPQQQSQPQQQQPSKPQQPQQQQSQQQQQQQQAQAQVPPHSDEASDPADLNSPSLEVMLNEAERYSGAASDGLREYLIYKEKHLKDPDQKLRNVRLAYHILGVQMDLNVVSKQVVVSMDISGRKQPIVLRGVLGFDRKAQLTSQTPGLNGALTCMDEGSTCETRVIILTYKGARVPVIFRRSNLSLDAVFPNEKCISQECEELYSIFRRTEMNWLDRYTLKSAKMESYEVIQGRSAFKMVAVTNHGEAFKIAGPLANTKRYPQLNTPANRVLTNQDRVDPETGRLLSSRLNEALHDVRIVSNNGFGSVGVLVKMKLLGNGDRDVFQLTLNRKLVPIRAILESASEAGNLP